VWAQQILAAFAVVELEQNVDAVASGFGPQFGGMQRGHQQFDAIGGVHFFAHDLLDAAQHAPAQRQVRIDAGGQLTNKAAAQKQRVSFVIGFYLAQSRREKLRLSHCLKNSRSMCCLVHFINLS
jgi:hypothetical protein